MLQFKSKIQLIQRWVWQMILILMQQRGRHF